MGYQGHGTAEAFSTSISRSHCQSVSETKAGHLIKPKEFVQTAGYLYLSDGGHYKCIVNRRPHLVYLLYSWLERTFARPLTREEEEGDEEEAMLPTRTSFYFYSGALDREKAGPWRRYTSTTHHQSSIINHQPSIINHQSSLPLSPSLTPTTSQEPFFGPEPTTRASLPSFIWKPDALV